MERKTKTYEVNKVSELSCDMINGFQNKRAAVGGIFKFVFGSSYELQAKLTNTANACMRVVLSLQFLEEL